MKTLAFGTSFVEYGGRRLRPAHFAARSTLPVAAACVVAGGVRETLAALLSAPVTLQVIEPCVPSAQGWDAIARAAFAWRVCGASSEGAIVLRSHDARALAGAAFGEEASPERVLASQDASLSAMEAEVLRRVVSAIAGNLTAVCGPVERGAPAVHPVARIDGFVSYFELQLERPALACIGIALAREPHAPPVRTIAVREVLPVAIAARAMAGSARCSARRIARLHCGDTLAIERGSGPLEAALIAGGRTVARGEVGERDGRYALRVRASRRASR